MALTVACSSDGASDPSDLPINLDSLSPMQVVSRSVDALTGLSTFRFALSHKYGNSILTNGVQVTVATGTAAVPDSYTLNADTLVAGFWVNSRVVVIDQDSYMTHPITRDWQLLEPGTSPFGTFNPVSLIEGILEQIEVPTHAPPGSASAGTYAIDGILPVVALKSLTGGVDESAPPLKVRVTVDGASQFLVEARITGRATATESEDLIRTVRLFEFNSDITIDPPI
ncbi:MAG TPA: LppX_LprAFG lipoprotein [Dehalococcoidia bacterium]|jgi:hypothetical protein|nr:hypothetical protein [Chloroflexota bacterium]MDP5876226.1 LppX_LprAFG lipoprotein [Dehalococcoidia bacterium]MDP6273926.1 LppX_LprAFG lipoprotein [Dehalococcoidia bacterium]MDP7161723.1 LppX_LprAFG lipoprotein [Dehalococcoidia bacterium]MDP7212674.1 LppX_LprAFG lipoprotein [Dehalococcoidia bacterium]|tara:strand:+ start:1047 stop:1727 length:681 start_codon:yes stop_codon:yes gene_type:complete